MQTSILIQEIKAHGLYIHAIDGNLHVRPRHLITEAIRQTVRTQKAALVDFLETFQERAAMMEFDRSLSRQEAEEAAFLDLINSSTQTEIIRQIFADYEDEEKCKIPW